MCFFEEPRTGYSAYVPGPAGCIATGRTLDQSAKVGGKRYCDSSAGNANRAERICSRETEKPFEDV
jgi:hypothetical protein